MPSPQRSSCRTRSTGSAFRRRWATRNPEPNEQTCDANRDDGDELAAEDHAVDVDGWSPCDVAVLDREDAGRPRRQPESSATLIRALRTAAAPTADRGHGQERHIAGLNCVAE